MRTTSSTPVQFVETVAPHIVLENTFWHRYIVSAYLSKACVICDVGLGGEVMLVGYALVSPPASRLLLLAWFSSYLVNVCARFACFGRL